MLTPSFGFASAALFMTGGSIIAATSIKPVTSGRGFAILIMLTVVPALAIIAIACDVYDGHGYNPWATLALIVVAATWACLFQNRARLFTIPTSASR